MAEKRRHQRIGCAEKCFLYHSGSKYSGAVMNISISGVLVKLQNFKPIDILPGEECSLILSNEPEDSFCRYSGRIARVNSSGLGLELIEHEF